MSKLLLTEFGIHYRLESCGEESNFSLFQAYFVCDWWFNVDCSEAESLYALNEQLLSGEITAGLPGSNPGSDGSIPAKTTAAPKWTSWPTEEVPSPVGHSDSLGQGTLQKKVPIFQLHTFVL